MRYDLLHKTSSISELLRVSNRRVEDDCGIISLHPYDLASLDALF